MVIPRVMAALVMVHGSIYFIQMAVDLNNAIGNVAQSLGGPLTIDTLPWSASMSPATVALIQGSQDLFHALFALGVVVAVVILVLSYVIRIAMLDVLIVLAPLAALCSVLPDTRHFAFTWLRLFMVAVFMQAVQLIILRVAVAVGFGAGSGIAESLFALATLWILLKVPGTLHAAAQVETHAHTRCSARAALGAPSAHAGASRRAPPEHAVIRAIVALTAVVGVGLCGGTALADRVAVASSASGVAFVKPLAHSWISQGFGCTSFVFEPLTSRARNITGTRASTWQQHAAHRSWRRCPASRP